MIYVTYESCSKPLFDRGISNANAIGNPTTFFIHTFVMRNASFPVLSISFWPRQS